MADMPGTRRLLLEGGAEFGGAIAEADLQALAMAGGFDAPIAVLPTAAAPDNNHKRAGANALRWFHGLGARRVELVPVIDKTSADDPALAQRLRQARLIYLLGGFPGYLARTLKDSLVWRAALQAHEGGAVLGGSSAGAMVLCGSFYDPEARTVLAGLDLLPGCCILPHHNTFGSGWAKSVEAALPGATLIGIDERTGILSGEADHWSVRGAGAVTLYRHGASRRVDRGATFSLSESWPGQGFPGSATA
jgi:cyanophycinase